MREISLGASDMNGATCEFVYPVVDAYGFSFAVGALKSHWQVRSTAFHAGAPCAAVATERDLPKSAWRISSSLRFTVILEFAGLKGATELGQEPARRGTFRGWYIIPDGLSCTGAVKALSTSCADCFEMGLSFANVDDPVTQ